MYKHFRITILKRTFTLFSFICNIFQLKDEVERRAEGNGEFQKTFNSLIQKVEELEHARHRLTDENSSLQLSLQDTLDQLSVLKNQYNETLAKLTSVCGTLKHL